MTKDVKMRARTFGILAENDAYHSAFAHIISMPINMILLLWFIMPFVV